MSRWGMGSELSMRARAEITKKYARAYQQATKKAKGEVLDQVTGVTGWSRDNARRQLTRAARPRRVKHRRKRSRKYSYDATKVLQRVWAYAGYECGKYLVVAMPVLLNALERHGELVAGKARYSPQVRSELLAMSAATIDRYLAPARQKDALQGLSGTRPSPLLRSSITVRKAGDEVEDEPGFFEGDTVAHCGPTLKCQAPGLMEAVVSGFHRCWDGSQAASVLTSRLSARKAIGVAPASDPWGRNVLNQCTHSAVAASTSSMPSHGPRLRISSALQSEFKASARALMLL